MRPTSELSNHVLVLLQGLLQDFLSRVHLPAPLGAHRVGVVSWSRGTSKHTLRRQLRFCRLQWLNDEPIRAGRLQRTAGGND